MILLPIQIPQPYIYFGTFTIPVDDVAELNQELMILAEIIFEMLNVEVFVVVWS